MHTVKWLKYCYLRLVILFVKYSYLIQTTSTQSYGFKLIVIIIMTKQFYLTHIWGNLGQSGPESTDNEGVLHIPYTPWLEPHHQMQYVILRTNLTIELRIWSKIPKVPNYLKKPKGNNDQNVVNNNQDEDTCLRKLVYSNNFSS